MTDGQFFVYYILAPETAVVCTGWWAFKLIRLRRARTAWLRRLEARQRRQANRPRRPAA